MCVTLWGGDIELRLKGHEGVSLLTSKWKSSLDRGSTMQRTTNGEELNVFEEMNDQCDQRCSEQGGEAYEMKVER